MLKLLLQTMINLPFSAQLPENIKVLALTQNPQHSI